MEADWYAKEVSSVFERQWFCVAASEEIPQPGDHVVCDVVENRSSSPGPGP